MLELLQRLDRDGARRDSLLVLENLATEIRSGAGRVDGHGNSAADLSLQATTTEVVEDGEDKGSSPLRGSTFKTGFRDIRRRAGRMRFREFLKLVWRTDAYYHQPASRWTIREAWFVAGVIARTCREIRRER